MRCEVRRAPASATRGQERAFGPEQRICSCSILDPDRNVQPLWSSRSRRPVLGRAACRRQAANLRVVCSLPSLRKREVTRSEPQSRGDQALSRCCSRRVWHCTPRTPQPRTPTNAARRAALAVGVRCRAPRVRAWRRRGSAANGCRRPSAPLPRPAAATARLGAP